MNTVLRRVPRTGKRTGELFAPCGYRKPARAAFDSLGVAYGGDDGNWRSMHPDFVVFQEINGKVRASIVDPHALQLNDAVIKLKALASFAAGHGASFHRIESLAKVDGAMRVLDMKLPSVRDAVNPGAEGQRISTDPRVPLTTDRFHSRGTSGAHRHERRPLAVRSAKKRFPRSAVVVALKPQVSDSRSSNVVIQGGSTLSSVLNCRFASKLIFGCSVVALRKQDDRD